MKTFFKLFLITTALFFVSSPAYSAHVSWEDIKSKSITLFYPGQSSWEWLLTEHSAAKSVRKGAPCLECHEDEEKDMGTLIVKGEKLEPAPIKGKPGFITAKLKTAYDNDRVYFQVQWKDTNFTNGNSRDTSNNHKIKVTLMLGDNSVKEYPVAGCWGVCHDDATGMKSYEGDKGRQLYSSASRLKIKRTGGGDDYIDEEDMQNLLDEKKFLEYWQARITADMQSEPVQGYILEKRHKQDNVKIHTSATFENGIWSVDFSREQNEKGKGMISIIEKHTYTLGIAIHDDYASGRKHYVTFGRSFSLGGRDTAIIATKQ